MITDALSRKSLLEAIERQILPRVENASAPLLLAQPAARAPGVRVTAHAAPLLRNARKSKHAVTAAHWVEEGFNSGRYPILMWVLEGEADYRIGVTRRMAAQNKALSPKHGYYVAALPAGSFFIVPPEVPISDGSRSHWERPQPETARSSLLWFHILPAGVSFHICSTQGLRHTSTRSLFLSEPRLLPLAEFLLHELQNTAPYSDALARHYLRALLLHTARALRVRRAPQEEDYSPPPEPHRVQTESTPVRRACAFIEAHASQKISIAQIAAHAYVSRSHLNRLFRSELGRTPAHYLAERRLELACSLLKTTDLPINRIGVLSGYEDAAYFNRVFVLRHKITPGAFRRRSRAEASEPKTARS